MRNLDVRRAAAGAGVKLWQIAEAMGMADSSLSRKLRRELPESEKAEIFRIVERLGREANSNG